jgi:hypothetical protein
MIHRAGATIYMYMQGIRMIIFCDSLFIQKQFYSFIVWYFLVIIRQSQNLFIYRYETIPFGWKPRLNKDESRWELTTVQLSLAFDR